MLRLKNVGVEEGGGRGGRGGGGRDGGSGGVVGLGGAGKGHGGNFRNVLTGIGRTSIYSMK